MPEALALNFFLRMLLGHLIGDFVLQPLWLAMEKRVGWRGLLIHVTVVTFATGAMIYQVVPLWWLWTLVLFAIHLFIDQFRTFVFTDNSRGKGVMLFVLDQIAHLLSIMLISWWAVGWDFSTLALLAQRDFSSSNNIIYLFCLLVFAIWVVPILEIELAVAIQSYAAAPGSKTIVPISFSDRIMGAFERVTSIVLFVVSMGILTPLAFIPRLYWLVRQDNPPNKVNIVSKTGISFLAVMVIAVLL